MSIAPLYPCVSRHFFPSLPFPLPELTGVTSVVPFTILVRSEENKTEIIHIQKVTSIYLIQIFQEDQRLAIAPLSVQHSINVNDH
jgi:hypothetical protein